MRVLTPFFDKIDPEFSSLRNVARDILTEETALMDIVQLVGRDSLSEQQKVRHLALHLQVTSAYPCMSDPSACFCLQVTLDVARIVREDFLQQNAFSEYDFNCPLVKSVQ